MVLNKDFREFIALLNANKVKYLIVGGYAVGLHGYPRYTKDLDVWVMISSDNAKHIIDSLHQFGFKSANLKQDDFLHPGEFIQLGNPPNRIDIITSCDGVEFDSCYENKVSINLEGVALDFIDLENLKRNKKSSGRLQDLADLENLESK
jgi:hypothetical protein